MCSARYFVAESNVGRSCRHTCFLNVLYFYKQQESLQYMSTVGTNPTYVRLIEFHEPWLHVSGMQDPLSNAVARANGLRDACNNVEVQLLDAGHCPHDEVPHLVNEGLLKFMNKVTSADNSKLVAPEVDRETITIS